MSKLIRVGDSTYEQLSKKGTLRDSFDSVIQQLLKDHKTEMLCE
jgi:predicted CopG family antitoxin